MAFESNQIKTIALQERFFKSFFNSTGTILSYYLCSSKYIADVMSKSDMWHVDNYIPIGQYRTDKLKEELENTQIPSILQEAKITKKKIIVALGFHTVDSWDESQCDALISWNAHLAFLQDMIKFAKNMQNSFVVLRYKDINWTKIKYFEKILNEINNLENIVLSEEYSKYFYSYDLCGNADLVIAKHTSLGDECLSLEIPVLFHEYSHNTNQQVSQIHEYESGVMCFSFKDLFEKASLILSSPTNDVINYKKLKNLYYGHLSDGNVLLRAHDFIYSVLKKKNL